MSDSSCDSSSFSQNKHEDSDIDVGPSVEGIEQDDEDDMYDEGSDDSADNENAIHDMKVADEDPTEAEKEAFRADHYDNASTVPTSSSSSSSSSSKLPQIPHNATTSVRNVAVPVVPMISKSWNIESIYGPIYTGGKVTYLEIPTETTGRSMILVSQVMGDVCFIDLQNHQRMTSIHEYENSTTSSSSSHVDRHWGDNEDSMMNQDNKLDRNAITAYAIIQQQQQQQAVSIIDDHSALRSKNTTATASTAFLTTPSTSKYTLMTCTQNNTLRLYTIQIGTTTKEDETPTTTTNPKILVQIQLVYTNAYSGHTLPVTDIQFHGSTVFAATASVDSTVRIWDTRNVSQPYLTHVFRPVTPQSSSLLSSDSMKSNAMLSVTCIRWIPIVQQLMIAIGRDDGSIAIHNLRHSATTGAEAQHPTNDSTHRHRTTKQQHQQSFNIPPPGTAIIVLRDHISPVTCMEWDVVHELFITSGRDAVIHVWKYSTTLTETTTNHRKDHRNTPSTFAYTRVSTLPIYEQVEGLTLIHFESSKNDNTDNAATTTTIATAGTKGQIRFWDIRSRLLENNNGPLLQKKYDIVPCHKISSHTRHEFFGEARGGYTSLQSLFASPSFTANFQQRNQQLLITDAEQNITFYSLSTLQVKAEQLYSLFTERTVVGYNDEILDLKIIPQPEQYHDRPSPERMVVVTNSTQIRVYDTDTLSCTTVYDEHHTATVLGIDVSPCGRYIVTCSKDQTIRLWSAALNITRCIAVGKGHTDAIGSIALSRKMNLYEISGKAAMNGAGAFCVSVSVDRTVKRWNLPGSTELNLTSKSASKDVGQNQSNVNSDSVVQLTPFSSAHAHEKDINIVAIAPNDSIIATGSQDKTVKLFKASNLSLLVTLKGHRRGVWDVCFSPYDRILATGSGDKSIKLWSLNDYSCVRTFQGHVASVLRVRFLSGGLQLVSSGADGLVKLWTVRTNETEATMDAHTDRVWALDITKDGKRMISGGADSQIVIWKDTTREMDEAKMAVEEEAILVDQQLANYLRRKEYGDALKVALERDKPHHALKILNAMIQVDFQKGHTGLVSIQSYVKGWNNEQILRILRYCREWNTRARNSHVALLTVKAIISTIPIHTLASISGVPEIVAGIIPYIERHYERVDRLHASSYLFDFALSSMGVIDATSDYSIDEYKKWEANSKLVMPPKKVDGRIDVGGNVIVGAPRQVTKSTMIFTDSDDQGNESDEIITIGESDDSEDE